MNAGCGQQRAGVGLNRRTLNLRTLNPEPVPRRSGVQGSKFEVQGFPVAGGPDCVAMGWNGYAVF